MALSGRLRSALPLFGKFLTSEAPIVSGRSASASTLGNPSTGLRTFASQTKPDEAKVKVPLALYGGTGNYATALFIAASKANALDKVESEILDVVAASKRSTTFSQFMKDVSVPKGLRVKAITDIFSEAGFSDITKNFMAILADNGRLRYLERIAKRFVDLTMAHRGEVKVIVTTVIPLPPEEEKELHQTLKEMLGEGKTFLVEQKIDPSILGGIIVEFDLKVFDMSIKTRAKQMEKILMEPIDFSNI